MIIVIPVHAHKLAEIKVIPMIKALMFADVLLMPARRVRAITIVIIKMKIKMIGTMKIAVQMRFRKVAAIKAARITEMKTIHANVLRAMVRRNRIVITKTKMKIIAATKVVVHVRRIAVIRAIQITEMKTAVRADVLLMPARRVRAIKIAIIKMKIKVIGIMKIAVHIHRNPVVNMTMKIPVHVFRMKTKTEDLLKMIVRAVVADMAHARRKIFHAAKAAILKVDKMTTIVLIPDAIGIQNLSEIAGNEN